MRIFSDRLLDSLNKGLKHSYLLFGNEPLFVQESRQLITQQAKAQGFEEVHRFTIDNTLDWNDVFDCCQALSLFAQRQVIELLVPDSGINATISRSLAELQPLLHDDILLIISGSKLTRAQESAKWFKGFLNNGVHVSCATPDVQRLPQWVMQRCRKLNLKADGEAIQLLSQWHEGNLFALSQSLEKLSLLYPDGTLTLVRVQQALSRHNHFTAFHWIDALLAGKPNRAQRILRQLEAEGIEVIILLRTLQKELSQLIQMRHALGSMSIQQVFDKYRIWQSKKVLYNSALSRLDAQRLRGAMRQLTKAEILAKTQYDVSAWPLIQQLTIELCATDNSLSFSS